MRADEAVSYSGTITSVVYQPRSDVATVIRIDHKAPTSWRIWYVAPADAYGRLIVSNESLTYQYEPKVGRVYSNPWSESAPPVTGEFDVGRLARNYTIDVAGPATVAGRGVQAVSVISKYSGNLVERFWIDDESKLVLRRERYHPDGSLAFKSEFDNVRLVNDLPKSLFDLVVPPGMALVAGASYAQSSTDVTPLAGSVRFKIVAPKDLPDGFALEKGDVASNSGVDTIQLVYTDGLRTFSLFENAGGKLPTFDANSAHAIPVGSAAGEFAYQTGVTLVSWLDDGLNLTLVGDLSPRELARIGADVKP